MTVEEAFQLLRAVDAPPGLIRQHELAVDTANELCAGVLARFPQLTLDIEHVLCGAALHDVGKVRVPEELHGPGSAHEAAGEALLLTLHVPATIAACCRSRSELVEAADVETIAVGLADALWAGTRDKLLEQAFADALTSRVADDPTEVWVAIDRLVQRIAADGPRRLAEADLVG